MRAFGLVAAVALWAVLLLAPSSGGGAGGGVHAARSRFRAPRSLRCQNGAITLEVKAHQWNADGEVSFLTRAYHYEGVAYTPAPTIVLQAGTSCALTIVNALPTNTPVSACAYHSNYYHCPDTTNVHTHGLHISGSADFIGVHILPGQQHTFTYNVAADHLMGTHWYHAHHHGASTLQLGGGMHGALIVEPADAYAAQLPADLRDLYLPTANETANPADPLPPGADPVVTTNKNQHICVLSHVWFGGSDTSPPTSVPFVQFDHAAVSAAMATAPEAYESLPPNAQVLKGNANIYVVNGQYQPYVPIQPNDVTLFRFIHAAVARVVELELVDPLRACTMVSVARDGIFQYAPYQNLTAVVLNSGNRADVAITCGAAAAGTNVTIRSFPSPARRLGLGVDNRHTQAVVMTLVVADVAAETRPKVTTLPNSSVRDLMPEYLRDTLGMTAVPSALIPGSPALVTMTGSYGGEGFNGQLFEGFHAPYAVRYLDRLCVGNVYDFRYAPPNNFPGGAGVHTFHQHTSPFQIVSINGANAAALSEIVRIGEWRDTIPAFGPGGTTVRVRPMDFAGDMMIHCHMVQHQDAGMMTLIRLTTDPAECAPRPVPQPLPVHEYRWQNGSNNNALRPDWTMADQKMRYDFTPVYHSLGYNMRNTSVTGAPLKPARLVSTTLLARFGNVRKNTRARNEMHTYWGLFIVGDVAKAGIHNRMSYNPVANVPPLPSINFPVPVGDPWFDPLSTGQGKINFRRTGAIQFPPAPDPGHVVYSNSPTGIMDLDSFYWPEREINGAEQTHGFAAPRGARIPNLRTFVGGKLNETSYYTPANAQVPDTRQHRAHFSDRMNKTPPTAMIATIFIREHNRLCDEFARAHPTWDDETLFHEARRMVIAFYQKISSREYLAPLLGEPLPPYTGYNASVEPHTSLLFATAAFRYGHTEVGEYIKRLDRDGNEVPGGDIAMRTCIYRPQPYVYDAGQPGVPGLETLVFGLAYSQQGEVTLQMTDALRQLNIFGGLASGPQYLPATTYGPATDLGLINIMRGRDQGLPPYNDVRQLFGLPRARSWADVVGPDDTTGMAAALAQAYDHVDDCDLWVCGLAEPHVASGNVGPVFKAIIMDQFRRFRDGDRFWFENPDQFSADEIATIYETTWPQIIARNIPAIGGAAANGGTTGLGGLQPNPFFTPTRQLANYGTPLVLDPTDTSYEHQLQLHPTIILQWTPHDDRIDFRVKTSTQGWVGLGWESQLHTMKGADIVFMSYTSPGVFVVDDRYALDIGIPVRDADVPGGHDDLTDVRAYALADTVTVYEFSRSLTGRDLGTLDNAIPTDRPTKVLFAFNPTTKVPSYHGPTRSPDNMIHFFPPSNIENDSRALQTAIIAVAALGIAASLAALGGLIHYRRSPRIINATFLFCLLIPVGAIAGFVSVILNAVPQTEHLCKGKYALLSVCFVLVYGAILIKTWRIHAIFAGMHRLKSVKITTVELAAYLSLWLLVDLAVAYGLWEGLDPTELRYITASNGKQMPVCQSKSDAGLAVFVAYKLATLLYGAYLAATTRDIDDRFNESSALAQSIYVTLVISVVCTLIGYALRTTPNLVLVMYSVGVIASLVFTVGAQFLPKFLAIRKHPTETGNTVLGNSNMPMSAVGGGAKTQLGGGGAGGGGGGGGVRAPQVSRANAGNSSNGGGGGGHGSGTRPNKLSGQDGTLAGPPSATDATRASGTGDADQRSAAPSTQSETPGRGGFKRASTINESRHGAGMPSTASVAIHEAAATATESAAGEPVPVSTGHVVVETDDFDQTRAAALSDAPPPPPPAVDPTPAVRTSVLAEAE